MTRRPLLLGTVRHFGEKVGWLEDLVSSTWKETDILPYDAPNFLWKDCAIIILTLLALEVATATLYSRLALMGPTPQPLRAFDVPDG